MQGQNTHEGDSSPRNPLFDQEPASVKAVVEDGNANSAAVSSTRGESPKTGKLKQNLTIVTPSNNNDSPKRDGTSTGPSKPGLKGWIAKNPRLFTALAVFAVMGVLAVIIVPSVCSTVGCKPKSKDRNEDSSASLRVIVRFNRLETTVKQLLPLLSQYFNSTKLQTSALEILQFDDPEVLKQVKKLLQEKYSAIIDIMVDDFVMSIGPTLDSLTSAQLGSLQPPAPADPTSPDVSAPPGSPVSNVSWESGQRRLSTDTKYPYDDTRADPMENQMWHLNAVNAAQAWAITRGVEDVVVAVMDTGIDVDHPDLSESIWRNAREIPANGIDDDGNGFIDDFSGYDFAGPCTTEWRRTIPPPAPAPPSPPPPRRIRALQQDVMEARIAPSPPPRRSPPPGRSPPPPPPSPLFPIDQTYAPGRCGSDPDPRPDPADSGHGTHVAGLVAAVRGNGQGGSGLAPRVKIMALKVADPFGNFYASNIIAAYDYALRMRAHVVSNSFGPREPNFFPADYEKAEDARRYRLFVRAVEPLAQKGVLLVAAAGNENSNLDRLRDVGMNYLPCTLDLPNVLCVAASGNNSRLWNEVVLGRSYGTNYGSMAVDIAAPGAYILSTTPQNTYGVKTGSSMATPLVSATAALVLSVLGSNDDNYFQASRVKNILLESGDTRPGLQVASQRTLNAARAVQSAMAFSGTGSLLLAPMTVNVSEVSGALARVFSESYYRISPQARDALAATPSSSRTSSPALNVVGLRPFATGVRPSVSTTVRGFKYVGPDVIVATRAQLLLQTRGSYRLNLITTAPLSRVAVTVGQRQLSWNATASRNTWSAVLQVDTAPAWYDFEILYGNDGNEGLEIRWLRPGQTTFTSLPDGWVFSGSMAPVTLLPYMPRDLPTAANSPASEVPAGAGGWNVLWNVLTPPADSTEGSDAAATIADPAGARVFDPTFLGSLTTDQQYPYSVFLDELLFASNTTLAAALTGGAVDRRQADRGAVMALADGPVYGIATTYIQSPANAPLSVTFRITCSHCALYLDGMLFHETLDSSYVSGSARPPAASTRVTPCVTLDPTTTSTSPATGPYRAPRHQLQVRFATWIGAANAGLFVQQAACGTSTASLFSDVRTIAAPGPWYKATGAPLTTNWSSSSSSSSSPGSIQCNIWDAELLGGYVSSQLGNIPRPEDVTPTASFRLPNSRAGMFPCTPFGAFCPAGQNFTTKINDIIPVAQLPDYLYVRCWAWWSRGFNRGLLQIHSADSLTLAVYLGGQQVYQSLGYGDMAPYSKQSRAPNVTMMGAGRYRQLVTFEWHLVSPYTRLRVVDGTVTMPSDGSGLIIDNSFFAPSP